MLFLLTAIFYYALILALMVIFVVNLVRKALVHWKYFKVVEGRFTPYDSYLETVFSFDFTYLPEMLQIILPYYSRNHSKEMENDNYRQLGEELKKVFWWTYGSLITIFALQILMLIFSIIVNFTYN